MSTNHVVRPGESLSKIAAHYGFHSWRTIYDDPHNVQLRKEHPNPDVITPGDKIYIPDRKTKQVSVQTDQALKFQVKPARTETRLRSITILIHGVKTDAAWFYLIIDEMKKKSGAKVEAGVEKRELFGVIPFTWGDYENQKQGGRGIYAADEMVQLFENPTIGYDRIYQGHSAVRLKELIDEAHKIGVQVNVIGHSNGTLVTSAALLLGAKLDNFVLMGSPIDCDNDRSQGELKEAIKSVSGEVYSFWSPEDGWATVKGGIGGFGDNATYRATNPRIKNEKFVHGLKVLGLPVYGTKNVYVDPETGEVITTYPMDHSGYMKAEHMPIFSAFIRKFADAGKGDIVATKDTIDKLWALRLQGDWTRVSYYKDEENVTLESPDMVKYKTQIERIERGPPKW